MINELIYRQDRNAYSV